MKSLAGRVVGGSIERNMKSIMELPVTPTNQPSPSLCKIIFLDPETDNTPGGLHVPSFYSELATKSVVPGAR